MDQGGLQGVQLRPDHVQVCGNAASRRPGKLTPGAAGVLIPYNFLAKMK